ncbi:MAG TPA: TrpR-like protein, YerC/YecD [Clostridiales bacterium]|nr:TrpR-like protein, YerC/YecD [Clostridiales bacterium]
MSSKFKSPQADQLFDAILSLQSIDECYDFFEDLCTVAELRAMIQRFEIALMLDKGKIYTEITKKTGASAATISRVHKSLNYGENGYKRVIERLKGK